MVAAVTPRTSLSPLAGFNVAIKPQSGWEKFLDILAEIFTFSLAKTRWGDHELPEEAKRAVADKARQLLADSATGGVLRDAYRVMRRDLGYQTEEVVFTQLRERLRATNPDISNAEIRAAAGIAVNVLDAALADQAPVPSVRDGFISLTHELHTTLPEPRAVARAQGEAFARLTGLLSAVTHEDHASEGTRDALGLGGFFSFGITWGATVRMDQDAAPGVITADELRSLRQQAETLPESDRRILGVILQQMLARRQVSIRGASQDDAQAVVAVLLREPANESELASGRLLASLAALDYATARLGGSSQSLPALSESDEEACCAAIAGQLARELAAVPPSVQRLARTYLDQRLSSLPEGAHSAALERLRTLAGRSKER